MNLNYFAISSRSIIWFKFGLGLSIIWRQFERLGFLFYFQKTLPELYVKDFNLLSIDHFSLVQGNTFQTFLLYALTILLAIYFSFGKRFFNQCCLALGLLLYISSRDPIFAGKGLKIIYPLLAIAPILPKQNFSLKSLVKEKSAYVSKKYFFIHLYFALIYFFAYLFKSDPLWTSSGEALFYFFKGNLWPLDWTKALLEFPGLLKVATFSSLALELSALLLVFLVFFKQGSLSFKKVLCAAFIVFHLLIAATSLLQAFSIAMISCWLLVFPSSIEKVDVLPAQDLKTLVKEAYGLLALAYLFISIALWNLLPKNPSPSALGIPQALQHIRGYFYNQNWALVAPSPGLFNYEFSVQKKSKEENVILYSSADSFAEHNLNRHMKAYLTAAYRHPKLAQTLARSYCPTGTSEVSAVFKKYPRVLKVMDPMKKSRDNAKVTNQLVTCEPKQKN